MSHPNLHTLGTLAFRHSRHPRQSCQTTAGDFLRYASWMARRILVRFCSVDCLHSFEMCSHNLAGSGTLPLGLLHSMAMRIHLVRNLQNEIIYSMCKSTSQFPR